VGVKQDGSRGVHRELLFILVGHTLPQNDLSEWADLPANAGGHAILAAQRSCAVIAVICRLANVCLSGWQETSRLTGLRL
jgi:hypothetical protein